MHSPKSEKGTFAVRGERTISISTQEMLKENLPFRYNSPRCALACETGPRLPLVSRAQFSIASRFLGFTPQALCLRLLRRLKQKMKHYPLSLLLVLLLAITCLAQDSTL